MKRTYLFLFALVTLGQVSKSQVISVDAPQYNGDFSAFVGPNAFTSNTLTIAHHRACYLIEQSELARMVLTNSVITDFGFDIYRPSNVASVGQFTLYLENTNDVTYTKGTAYPALLTGMSTNYTGNLTLPAGLQSATTAVSVPLSNSFTWTGGGIYVAFDWFTATPTGTTITRYLTNFDGGGMGANASAPAAGPAPTTLTVDIRRPVMRFKTTNTATNELEVVRLIAPGSVSKLVSTGFDISAIVKNNSMNALTNVPVTLNVGGANTYNNVQNISNIPAGGTATVNFTPFAPTANGVNQMTASVAADQFPSNNMAVMAQSVNCTDYGNNPPLAASAFTSGAYGYGSQAIIATPMTPPSSASISAIKFAPGQIQSGSSSVCGVLLDASGNIIAMTNTVNLTAASFGTYANLKFTPPEALTGATTYYYGIAQLSASTFPFGTSAVLATTNLNLYYTVPIGGGSIGNPQNHMGHLGLQAVLGFSNTTLFAGASHTLLCKGDEQPVTLMASGMTTYTWVPGGQGASIVVTPTVSGASGNVNYNVTGTDGPSGCRSTAVVVTVSVAACTGVAANNSNGFDVKLFPNPAVNGKATITGLVGTNAITVYNTLGQIVLTKLVSDETTMIDLSSQPSGNYMVKITDSNKESRLVKVINQN